ncbi:glycosyltransferase [Nodosilinea sp. E11]|uniref:glycosyltransferase n=1 Tax=Nodosilinea sp. E11 TaxID=3037479 RepID=UPI002934AFCB|nr:glycosyltransferase [Nodosilinea sp. E11]WOD40408.1 glycosyltransferase [Nodosilinea sp. E11]
MKSLLELYREHQGKVSDKWSLYLDEYDRLFSGFRNQPIRLLEIGIQNGGSLEIWGKYFSNAESLIGCDINPDCSKLSYDDHRISVVVGDANTDTTEDEIIACSSSFNLIIDDGSHVSDDIVKSFARYFRHLNEGGLFVIEDLHCSYWSNFQGGLYYPYSSLSFCKRLADIVNHEHWGVERERKQLLQGFTKQFSADFDELSLSKIHSIEFVNSICIIRKQSTQLNLLGSRFIAGKEIESVVSGHYELSGTTSPVKGQGDQVNNPWSRMLVSPEEDWESLSKVVVEKDQQIAVLSQAVTQRDQQISAYLNSRSYRITSPLRYGAHQVTRLRNLLHRETLSTEGSGGFRSSVRSLAIALRRKGLKRLFLDRFEKKYDPDLDNLYKKWVNLYDTLDDSKREKIRGQIQKFPYHPLISIVMPVYNPPAKFLNAAIESVMGQLYPHWELCIADDASTNPEIRQVLEHHAAQDDRIKVFYRSENGHISEASNSALSLATGDFVALLDHDDELSEHALFCVAKTIVQNPEAEIIYSDEDKIDESGQRFQPYFKCDFNYELFLAQNMVGHLTVYRHTLVEQVEGFRGEFNGSQDYDLLFRAIEQVSTRQIVHIPHVLYHWRAISGSTALSSRAKSYAVEAGRKAVAEHLRRSGVQAEVLPAPSASVYNRVRFQLPSSPPLVSIVIPTRDRSDLLSVCISSILMRTSYPNYEIIVIDNGSVEQATIDLFERLPSQIVRVIQDDSPFNFSALNNRGVQLAQGDVICLMNNDIEVLTPDWLEEMVSFAVRPNIGCVGARLWYPDGSIQHGGVILGLGGVAGHAHLMLREGDLGYFARAVLHQSLSVVTAACLVVRKNVFESVNGLDESLAVAFNDVDFCIRVRDAGYRNIWTPYAEMIHHESATRGYETTPEKQARFSLEVKFMQDRWGEKLNQDPAYNPNLAIDKNVFSYAFPPRVNCL